jgi:hypothetical protein
VRELHRLEEGDQAHVVGLVHREVGERHVELTSSSSVTSLFDSRALLGIVDQRLAALLLLDLAARRAAFRDRRIRR